MTNQPVKSVAIIGAGTIGASWAVCFTTHGLEARLYDEAPGALDRAELVITGEGLKTLDAVRGSFEVHEIEPRVESFEAGFFAQAAGSARCEASA